ncbi:MAG: hypothetical protein A2Z21_07265 [Candidatus Fraserbacteria bacterium RBG_16_55_9]|uniref:LmbE family protein n=1 Tax=Fraserbacteria sp. (strain RBG_16_55_9) TaxID=1817864 RepID=A0A1F5UTM3_FRAXR|nr:MAG: hypothetical protein A2Z21_07265 [Candidatus Fraserbacteria bacterium RBG_16_55_9]
MPKELLGKSEWERRWRVLLVLLLGSGSVIGFHQWYFSSPGEVAEIYTGELRGPALVIAPHNDDEVLGAGGAIQRHIRQGDRVTVVLLTNGDGQYRGPLQSRSQAIQFGYRRQEETFQALEHLGVPRENIYYLGYPDRGLAQLWDGSWNCQRPYTSPQTGADYSPYTNSFTPNTPYCGLSVVRDLEAILEREKPKILYLPHPNDTHPDHWSANAFTLYALEQLKLEQEGSYSQIRLFTYLVHYGRWPMPRGIFLGADIKLPQSLASLDTHWLGISLTPEDASRKYQAILHYRSQVQYMLLYLMSFARRNELFGEVPTLSLPEDQTLSYPDPKQYTLVGSLRGYNDIKAVHLTMTADERLVIEVEFFDVLHSSNDVLVHLRTIGVDASLPAEWRFLRADGKLYLNGELLVDSQFTQTARQNAFWLSLPVETLGNPQAFLIGAKLMRKDVTFSKAAYRLVEITPSLSLTTR